MPPAADLRPAAAQPGTISRGPGPGTRADGAASATGGPPTTRVGNIVGHAHAAYLFPEPDTPSRDKPGRAWDFASGSGRWRPRPGLGLLAQLPQNLRAVRDIDGGLEHLGHRVEGVAVVAEVDLHAANVDVRAALAAQLLHLAQRLRLRRKVEAVGARRDRPGPGSRGALVGQPAPEFGERHHLDQAGREYLGALRPAGQRGARRPPDQRQPDLRQRRRSGRARRTNGGRLLWSNGPSSSDDDCPFVRIRLRRRGRAGRSGQAFTAPSG